MVNFENFYETVDPQDQYFDYCLWQYAPHCDTDNKFRSINLLIHSFATAGLDTDAVQLCHRIRSGLGINKTVWGVKQVDGQLSWELYFYDYQRLERSTSLEKLLNILEPTVQCPLQFDAKKPYFMFSIDIDNALLKRQRNLDEINIYIGNPSTAVSSGICYSLTKKGLQMNNLYYFFDRQRHWQDIVAKTFCSAHLRLPDIVIDELLWPELTDCQTIVVANKKHNDGLYFSRIGVSSLILFLKRCGYPNRLIDFIETNSDRLDHLLYDVGIDYVMEGNSITILKSAYYGFF